MNNTGKVAYLGGPFFTKWLYSTSAVDGIAGPKHRTQLRRTGHQMAPCQRHDVLAHMATSTYVAMAENVILLGLPGLGKTHLAIGLGVKAAQAGQHDVVPGEDLDAGFLALRCR